MSLHTLSTLDTASEKTRLSAYISRLQQTAQQGVEALESKAADLGEKIRAALPTLPSKKYAYIAAFLPCMMMGTDTQAQTWSVGVGNHYSTPTQNIESKRGAAFQIRATGTNNRFNLDAGLSQGGYKTRDSLGIEQKYIGDTELKLGLALEPRHPNTNRQIQAAAGAVLKVNCKQRFGGNREDANGKAGVYGDIRVSYAPFDHNMDRSLFGMLGTEVFTLDGSTGQSGIEFKPRISAGLQFPLY